VSGDGGRVPRPFRMLLECDVAEVERRLRLYRANTPKRIAEEMRLHVNTVSAINLGGTGYKQAATEVAGRAEARVAVAGRQALGPRIG
jgi:hypothetical protein